LNLYVAGLTADMTNINLTILTSNNEIISSVENPGAVRNASNYGSFKMSVICDMDASDTLSTVIYITGDADTADIYGSGACMSWLNVGLLA